MRDMREYSFPTSVGSINFVNIAFAIEYIADWKHSTTGPAILKIYGDQQINWNIASNWSTGLHA